jgi:hypothetical protein
VKTWRLTYDEPDRYGRKRIRTVSRLIDIADFTERPGFAWLLIAANPDLSVRDLQEVLLTVGVQHERPIGWLSRRRWMFHGMGKAGRKANADGMDDRARQIMAENPSLSSRQIVYLLREKYNIRRTKNWVMKNRVTDLSVADS